MGTSNMYTLYSYLMRRTFHQYWIFSLVQNFGHHNLDFMHGKGLPNAISGTDKYDDKKQITWYAARTAPFDQPSYFCIVSKWISIIVTKCINARASFYLNGSCASHCIGSSDETHLDPAENGTKAYESMLCILSGENLSGLNSLKNR